MVSFGDATLEIKLYCNKGSCAFFMRGSAWPRIFYFINERTVFMPNYEKLYHKLFNDITDIIEGLKMSQQEAEELYLQSCEEEDKNRADFE